jgi:hypothetical protein
VRRTILLAVLLVLLAVPALAQAPVVTVTASTSGPAPATVTLDVAVEAAGGTPMLVECFNGEALIGTDDEAPYRIAWADVPAGTHAPRCTAQIRPATVIATGASTPIVVVEPETYSNYPLIKQWSEVAAGYVGCFRIPPGPNNVLNYSGHGLTVSGPGRFFLTQEAARPQVGGFVGVEIQEPATIAPSATTQGCAVATIVQQPAEVWEGKFTQLSDPSTVLYPGHVNLWGLLAIGDQLCMVGGINYDASNSGKRSAFCRSRTLAERGTVSNAMHFGTGTYTYPYNGKPITDEKPGYTFGYMGWIPAEWQPVLGADACAGGTGKNITFRQSQGPSLTCFQSSELVKRQPNVPAQFLLNYPLEQREMGERMLGWWQSSALPEATAWWPEYEANGWTPKYNPDGSIKLAEPRKPLSMQYGSLWNGTGRINSFAWPNKSRTIMFIANMGIGEWCYKDCPTHPVNPTTTRPNGTTVIGGHHAEPDTYRVWFYDALDLVKVRNGQLKPWQVMPYRVENITLPGPKQRSFNIRSAIVDARTNRLYVAQYSDTWTEGGGYVDSPPVFHVYQLK